MSDAIENQQARVFFALWPNETERRALANWQPVLQQMCAGRTMPRAELHATLVFLGNVAIARLEALKLAAQEVCGKQFEICFDAAHYWGYNHLVCAVPAVTPPDLLGLVSELEVNLRKHQINFDERSYKPHVTLLRHARWSDRLLPEMPPQVWQVRDFVLLRSQRNNQGANYEILARFPLGERSPV